MEIPRSKQKIKRNLLVRIANKTIRISDKFILSRSLYKRFIKSRYPINTPGEIIWCATNLINYLVFNVKDEKALIKFSSIEDGDWDKNYIHISKLPIYNALYEFIINNKPLKETEFYNPNIKTRKDFESSSTWQYLAEYNFEKRRNAIENLINSIKISGYKTQSQLNGNPRNEIIVKIGRNGEIFFFDGVHRFCISKILGVETIPVIVKSRHPEWIKLKRILFENLIYKKNLINDEDSYDKILMHPDLADIVSIIRTKFIDKINTRISFAPSNHLSNGL